MRDEVTGPVIVPRNFHCVTRILTYNMDKAVRNEGTVGTDPFSEGFIPLLLQKKKKKKRNSHFILGIMSTSSHSKCPRQPYFILQQDMRSVGVRLLYKVIPNWWEGLSRMGNSLPIKKAVHFTLSFNLAEQLLAFFREGEHVPWTKTVYNH